jgi:hypothetical protein
MQLEKIVPVVVGRDGGVRRGRLARRGRELGDAVRCGRRDAGGLRGKGSPVLLFVPFTYDFTGFPRCDSENWRAIQKIGKGFASKVALFRPPLAGAF